MTIGSPVAIRQEGLLKNNCAVWNFAGTSPGFSLSVLVSLVEVVCPVWTLVVTLVVVVTVVT